MRRSLLLAGVLLLMLPAASGAQEPPRTDPEVGSPAEAVYGIPLEEARRDAAPGVVPGTAIRTEQGVGSSANVPGIADDPSMGSEPDPETVAARERERRRVAARAAARISGEPSTVATAAVLVLVVAIAAAGGVAAGRLTGARTRL